MFDSNPESPIQVQEYMVYMALFEHLFFALHVNKRWQCTLQLNSCFVLPSLCDIVKHPGIVKTLCKK